MTLSHWGAYEIQMDGTRFASIRPFRHDPDPSPIGQSLLDTDSPVRVRRPAIRESWLRHGPGAERHRRGVDRFVNVEWDECLDRVSSELDRIRGDHGNQAIFAGSYGWASAGRFHHAQSQIHRFMNLIGGYTGSVNSYSLGAAEVVLPHILGMNVSEIQRTMTSWPIILESTDLIVAFGGIPPKNSQVQYGGHGAHRLATWLDRFPGRLVNVGPLNSDLPGADWLPIRPNTDTALMLSLMHTLLVDGAADESFLERYTVGADHLKAYLLGEMDGEIKSAAWASGICDLPENAIISLARRMASGTTMLNLSWSLQRADHGEQPYWAGVALGAFLGQIGIPGGGLGVGYGAIGTLGNGVTRAELPHFPQGNNPVDVRIPVARLADMLLGAGDSYEYNGEQKTYPEIRLVYWAGGNPFHHHQDLNRLARAWQVPDTVIVHEPFWTATARRADIVLPVTTPLERDDLGGSPHDNFLFYMEEVIPPVGKARNDFEIFGDLAERLGVGATFTEGRTASEWVAHLYERFRTSNPAAPRWEDFTLAGYLEHQPSLGQPPPHHILLADFRSDPERYPLSTPSGRIELFSERVAAFGYSEVPGHPIWIEPYEWLGRAGEFPLHLISNQPSTRLHSQWNHGRTSTNSEISDREPISINPQDAAARNIAHGDVVRVFNSRGACLAGAVVDDGLRRSVVRLSTGAWFDPLDPSKPGSLDLHGNPNTLTCDVGTSRLAQGSTAQTCLVEVERWDGPLPPVTSFNPPAFVEE